MTNSILSPGPTPGNATLLDAALSYARRGWSIFPTQAKKPACTEWKPFQRRPPSEEQLRKLFSASNITGLAVVLGPASGGIGCRDYDLAEGYSRWASAHPRLANEIPTVETHRGFHLYFRGPEGFTAFGDGEYRADSGHYCLLPPSLHPSGNTYRWLIPLPSGDLPLIDPDKAGLFPRGTQKTQRTQRTQLDTEDTCTHSKLKADMSADVEGAIIATLPIAQGHRYRKIFELCRKLKALPKFEGAEAKTLRPIVTEWHKRALAVVGTKAFSETWADFIIAWGRVKYPAGQGRIEGAFHRAVKSKPPENAAELYADEPPILLLASFCRELQRIAGTADFFLDCRTVGRLLGVPHNTAWRWLTVLCADGILRAGEKGSQATHKASRFRFMD